MYCHNEFEYEYNDTNWGDKLTSYNGTTITYDNIGNPLTYRDGMTMQWLVGRQLYKVNTGNDIVEYTYNADGLRTSKDSNNCTTYYYYDNNNNMIAQKKGGSVMYFQYDCEGNVVSMTFEGSRYYYVKNQQGDIEKIINHSGNVVVTYKYDAWGNICDTTDTSGVWGIGTMNPFRYRGYIYDDETGLYYLKSRYYDPITGRFLNSDIYTDTRTGTPLSINMFAYCENDFVNLKDTSGQVVGVDDAIIFVGIFFTIMIVSAMTASILSNPSVQEALNELGSSIANGIKSAFESLAKEIDAAVSRATPNEKKKGKYEKHHIVAKKAKKAKESRKLLKKAKIPINSDYNLIKIKYSLHRRLHTNKYHKYVYDMLKKGNGKKKKTIGILDGIKVLLTVASGVSPD